MEWLLMSEPPGATFVIMLIALCISFTNSSINRALISRTVGWERYKVIQKEVAEYQSQVRQALRAKDTKLLEKLKKREKQILQMQSKAAKPQLIMFGLSFSYLLVWWFLLLPLYDLHIVAYIPGIAPINIIWWYSICSMFSGIVSSRLLGIMRTE